MPERVLSAEDVRVIAGACVSVIHAYVSRGPSSTLATLTERATITRLADTLDAIERERQVA